MKSENIQTTTSKKDWDDFFAERNDSQNAFEAVDSHRKGMCVACEFSGGAFDEAIKRLDEPTPKKIRIAIEFEFDR